MRIGALLDPAIEQKPTKPLDSGVTIQSVAELEEDGKDWRTPLHEMIHEIAGDVPNPDGPGVLPLERFAVLLNDRYLYCFKFMFVAFCGNKMVGYSRLNPAKDGTGIVQTGLSGCRREYRRRGIVTALKVRGIGVLEDRGYKYVCTDNDETNPMYQINLRMGFHPCAEFRAFKHQLCEGPSPPRSEPTAMDQEMKLLRDNRDGGRTLCWHRHSHIH